MTSRKSALRGVLDLVRFLVSGRCPVLILMLALLLPMVARAQTYSVPTQGRWIYCYITVPMPPKSMGKQFVSGVFQSDGDLNSVSLAWDIYIGKKYAPVNQKELLDSSGFHSPHCNTGSQISAQQMYDRLVKGGVTAVDWKYVPGQDVPLQPKAVAQDTRLYYCSGFLGTTPNTRYFSDSFVGPYHTDINRVRDDFVRFIKEKYSPQSHEANGGCSSSDKAEEETPIRAAGKTIIETGWKPKTMPPPEKRH